MEKNLQYNNEKKLYKSEIDKQILDRASQFEPPFTISTEEALKKLKTKIASEPKVVQLKSSGKNKTIYWLSSIAAALLIIFAIWFAFIRKPIVEVVADNGQHSEYNLPDGSLVSLNAGSKINFDKKSFREKRSLKLSGEAFFNIRKGSTFTIETAKAQIKILGTSFNVYARNQDFKVSCVTGKIQVSSGKQSVIIKPGESAALEKNLLVHYSEKNISTVGTWRKGEFIYENTLLTSIFNEIERQYNVTFVLPNVNDKYFTGSFSNRNLVDALDIVCIPMGLTYEIGSNSKIVIRSKPE